MSARPGSDYWNQGPCAHGVKQDMLKVPHACEDYAPPLDFARALWLRLGGREGEKDKLENAQTKSSLDFQKADDLQHRLTETMAFRFSLSKWNRLGHRWQTQGPGAESSPPPCFYPVAAPSSLPLVKEKLGVYSPKITFGPLKATTRLMWPPVKMSLTPMD